MRRAWFLTAALALGLGVAGPAGAGRAARRPARITRPVRQRVVIDIGGEGRHPGAINVNPARLTSTTGTPGRPIPNLVRGKGERLPLDARVADQIFVEHAPIRGATPSELARVIKPGGTIHLTHPSDYAARAHRKVIDAVGGKHTTFLRGGFTHTIIRAPTAHRSIRARSLAR